VSIQPQSQFRNVNCAELKLKALHRHVANLAGISFPPNKNCYVGAATLNSNGSLRMPDRTGGNGGHSEGDF
jgi:hypothetical protein